jgi:LacI family transcriptional regulator
LGVDDDALVCNLAKPPLTSIAQDTYSAGYSAAQLLDRLMILQQQRGGSKVQRRSMRQGYDNGAGDGGYENAAEVPIVVKPLGVITRESTDTIAIEDIEVAGALQYIRRNFRQRLSVSDVLQTCSLSRRSMDYRFKKLVGRTPHEEIQRVRLNHVKQLLATTRLPITMIARRAGFAHGEYMTAVFRRVEGTTPTKYRRSHRNKQL